MNKIKKKMMLKIKLNKNNIKILISNNKTLNRIYNLTIEQSEISDSKVMKE